jgi:hypothetical protein
MRLQKPLILIILLGLLLVGLSFTFIPVTNVQAQCKNVSSCKNCHEVQGTFSVANNGLWHSQHALYDFCDVCHGGDKNAADKQAAHVGIKTKFVDLTQSCTNCHASDLDQRLKVYSDALGVQVQVPVSSAICTPTPSLFQGGDLFANPAPQNSTSPSQPQLAGSQLSTGQPAQSIPIVNKTGNIILKVLLGLIVLGGFIFIYRNEKYHFMPSNKERAEMALTERPTVDREALAHKIDQLSLESQVELQQLLDDPDQMEQILHDLKNNIGK